MSKKTNSKDTTLVSIVEYLHNNVQSLNNSKIFAGLMIITLNIVSKFVNIKLGKTVEGYLKYSFSKQLLIFAIAWMGTRDIYIALFITCLFVFFTEILFHEDSNFCIVSRESREYYCNLVDSNEIVTEEDIRNAKETLKKAQKQNANKKTESKIQNDNENTAEDKPKDLFNKSSGFEAFSFR